MFPNFWQGECSGGARRRAWKRSGLRRTLNATVSKVDNLVWLPSARKRESWSRGPTVDDFCAGTHGCPPKIGDPRLTQRGPRVDLRPLVLRNCAVTVSSTGAENQFQADDNGHVGRPCDVSLAPPYPELFASYGASAVTRTPDRGHVAEVFSIQYSVSEKPISWGGGSKVNPGSPMGQPWVPVFWGATVGSRTKIVNRGSPIGRAHV